MRTIKFEIDELAEVLAVFGKVVSKKASKPILENVIFSPISSKEVELKCTDVSSELSTTMHMENDLDQMCGISLATLQSICANNPKTYVELTLDAERGQLNARTINGDIISSMMGDIDFEIPTALDLTESEEQTELVVNGHAFADSLNDVAFARATDKTREILCYTYVDSLEDGSINVVATDGRVLSIKNIPAYSASAKIIITTTPASVISAIRPRMLTIKRINTTCAIAYADGYTYKFSVPEDNYPNYNAVYPNTEDYKVYVCNASTLGNALKRAKDFGNKASGLVNLTFGDHKINVRSTDYDYCTQISEDIPCTGNTDGLKIGVSYIFFNRILTNISGANVRVMVRASDRPLVVQGADTKQRFLLMPMALDEMTLGFGEIKPEDEVEDEEIEETEDEVEDEEIEETEDEVEDETEEDEIEVSI